MALRSRRLEAMLFTTALTAVAYFHQGGGWNQNARFAMVRAVVEEGRLSIDDYLVYQARWGNDKTLRLDRLPVRDGVVSVEGKTYPLAWDTSPSGVQRVDGRVPGNAPLLAVSEWAASGDVAFYRATSIPTRRPERRSSPFRGTSCSTTWSGSSAPTPTPGGR